MAGPFAAGSASAASCNGKSHAPAVLTSGAASPGTGTSATTITFSVHYTDVAGCAPTEIQVVITGLGQFAMSGPGSGFDSGVTFVVSRTLPAGSWDFGFTATSGSGAGEQTAVLTQTTPNRVVITAPTPPPTPAPTPPPTPKPTARPTPAPTSPPTPRPTAPPTPATTPAPTAATQPTPGATDAPAATPGGSVAPTGTQPPPGSSAAASAAASPSDGVALGGGSGGAGPGGGAAGPGGGAPSLVPGNARGVLSSSDHDSQPGTVAVGLVAAASSVLAIGAVGAATRRRRRDDAALAAAAGAAVAVEAPIHVTSPPLPPPPVDGPPPWLALTGRAPARFDAGPKAGVDRKTISYRFVRVSDGPDDLRSREVGRLDRGDEVEVVDEQDGMLLVRAANGLQGWVPRVVIVG